MLTFSVQSGAFAYFNANYGSGSGPYHLTAVEVRHPYSAVAIQELEYTTTGQEMKQELTVLVSLWD